VKLLAVFLGQSVHDGLTTQLRLRIAQCGKPLRIGVQLESALSAGRIGVSPFFTPTTCPPAVRQRIAVATPTSYRAAAERADIPRSTALTTRSRSAASYFFGIKTSRTIRKTLNQKSEAV